MKKISFILTLILFIQTSLIAEEITYKEILENPTDLELNLNFAKQQENTGNLKLTISTLERLNMLYPENLDIKLYLLSILIEMDSKVKVDLMVRTMMNDPNTPAETKKTIAKLLTSPSKEKESKWFAYLDLKYLQTEENNVSGITKSKKLLQEDNLIPYPAVDGRLVVEDDKTFNRTGALTIGKNLNNSSSVFFNISLDVKTIEKKVTGDSDTISSSLSYFKIFGNNYISPYAYWSKPNYRRQEDYEAKGYGFNNTYFINEKHNINYGLAFSETSYERSSAFTAADDNDSDVYSRFIKHNFNFTKKSQLGTKIILNRTEAKKEFDSYDSTGINLTYSHFLPIGTLKLSSTYLKNAYDEPETFLSASKIRDDKSFVNSISLEGQIIQLLPFIKNFKISEGVFYTLKLRQSDVSSNIQNHDVERKFFTIGLTKRFNLNELFK